MNTSVKAGFLAGRSIRIVLIVGAVLVTGGLPGRSDESSGNATATSAASGREPVSDSATFNDAVKPFFAKHCDGCHGADLAEGDLRLDTLAARLGQQPTEHRVQRGTAERRRVFVVRRIQGVPRRPVRPLRTGTGRETTDVRPRPNTRSLRPHDGPWPCQSNAAERPLAAKPDSGHRRDRGISNKVRDAAGRRAGSYS